MKVRVNEAVVRGAGRARQSGATLIEIMIALVLSMIVTGSMVVLMGNSLGSATRIIHMSQLTDELRNTMSMLTRDVRRANYNPLALYCYANADCGVSDDTVRVNVISDIGTPSIGGNTCLVYFLERESEAPGTTLGDVEGGGFRRATAGGVGRIEVWVGDDAPPADCSGNQWTAVTDPNLVNITAFAIDDVTGSFTTTITREDGSTMLTMRARQVRIQLEGQLLLESSITRRIEDVIRVRNDYIATPGV